MTRNKFSFALEAIFLCSFTLLLFTRCGTKKETAPSVISINSDENLVEFTDAQFKNFPIETTPLETRNFTTTIKLNGKIDVPPQNLLSVSAPLGGYLKSTNLLPGMKVRKGATIAIIENPSFIQLQQDYLIAKSKLQFAESDYNRQKMLNTNKASSDKIMQQALADMDSQRAIMNSLAQQLQLININPDRLAPDNIQRSVPLYSAINGFVSKVYVNIGKYVNPTDILFEFVDPTDIHLNLKVYERDLQLLKIGQRFVAYTNSDPGKKYEGEIILISKDVNEEGISDAHCHFENYEHILIPGMYMNAEVQVENLLANTLPEECVVNFEGHDFVFVETKKQTYLMTPASIGASDNGFVQIINNKDFAGKKIVNKNAYSLLMKLKNKSGDDF